MNDKIVVLAGNYTQFQYWLRRNIIPITSDDGVHRLRGIKIKEIYTEGDWYRNISPKAIKEIEILIGRRILNGES